VSKGKGKYDFSAGFKFRVAADDKALTTFSSIKLPGVTETVETFNIKDAQEIRDMILKWRRSTEHTVTFTLRIGWMAIMAVSNRQARIYDTQEIERLKEDSSLANMAIVSVTSALEYDIYNAEKTPCISSHQIAYTSSYRIIGKQAILYLLPERNQPYHHSLDGPFRFISISVDNENIGEGSNGSVLHRVFLKPVGFLEAAKHLAEKELP